MTWQPDIVIYHDQCIDGFTAAWACKLRYPDAEYIATNYGRSFSDEHIDLLDWRGQRLLIVDFSYSQAILEELVSTWAVHSIVVLDHHKTAEADLAAFQRFADKPERFTPAVADQMIADLRRGGYKPICALFDMERSGAGLAWDFAFGTDRPRLIDLVEDRDLWRFQFGDDSRHLHLALTTLDRDFASWSDAASNIEALLKTGQSMARYRDSLIAEIVQRAWMTTIEGKPAITVDCPYALVSETGHRLLELHPDAAFAAMRVAGQHATTFSLRSDDHRADVSMIARKFGGGGHRNAAGFRVPN